MENSRYVNKGGKMLRTGYTTGSCAAAAAKAAVKMLFTGSIPENIAIDTPKGWKLRLDVFEAVVDAGSASCCVVKDAGDDPDITDGVKVYARAERTAGHEIVIRTGKGIGMVTRAGLSVPVGKPAINPVPMSMIMTEVSSVLPEGCGVSIELSIPAGEELAKKTYNPKLGIVGGISVLGTSGIVEPMSEDAIKDTIAIELNCLREDGRKTAVLVPGNYGEDFCRKHLGIPENIIVKISNYLGFALEKCSELGFQKLLLAGHMGKLVKPAGGIFYTHSRVSDTRMEVLAAHLGVMGMKQSDLARIMECRTTEEALPIIAACGCMEVFERLAELCARRCEGYVFGSMQIGCYMFSMKELLAKSSKAASVLEEVLDE